MQIYQRRAGAVGAVSSIALPTVYLHMHAPVMPVRRVCWSLYHWSYAYGASGAVLLLLGNNWKITLHNLFTFWLCLSLQAPSNPLAAKGIQQRPFFEVMCSQLSSRLPWEINAWLQQVRISHHAFCRCFAFLPWLLSEKNRAMTASFISLFPLHSKRGQISFINADRVHGDLQIKDTIWSRM